MRTRMRRSLKTTALHMNTLAVVQNEEVLTKIDRLSTIQTLKTLERQFPEAGHEHSAY